MSFEPRLELLLCTSHVHVKETVGSADNMILWFIVNERLVCE